MYERFTDRARKVMQLADQEAMRLNHEYIGTEHILLGLIKEGSGVAANVLKNLGISLREIRVEVGKLVQSGPDIATINKLPQTPRAKKVIEFAHEEAQNLNNTCVGTEHLLLGLLREQEGVAAQVLFSLGLKLEKIREEIVKLTKSSSEIEHSLSEALVQERLDATNPKPSLEFRAENISTEELIDFAIAVTKFARMCMPPIEDGESIIIRQILWKNKRLEAFIVQ